jgi:hypothetical protein
MDKVKELEQRVSNIEMGFLALEEKNRTESETVRFLLMPILSDLLMETAFSQKRGLTNRHPLLLWIIRRLTEAKLPDEEKGFLLKVIEKGFPEFKAKRF